MLNAGGSSDVIHTHSHTHTHTYEDFSGGSAVKKLPAVQETQV